MANDISPQTLGDLDVPVLLMTGSSDLYVPPPILDSQAERIKDASNFIFSGVGHSANWESPRLFNETLLLFLAAHRRGGRPQTG
ncbi:hypothetical protein GCM10009710_37000 [Aeromicrobium alkaliterrae]|uniref:Alpha/beta hydrolase n=2 Tax=Aeromicrobium alkaliterrae TaxID=302168 RepID=A0ABN2KF57_9ACTN